jgi:hypothetical protein
MGKSASQQKHKSPKLLIASLIVFVLLFLGTAGFAGVTYSQKEDYKNNVDQKIAVAVEEAEQRVADQKEKDFLEREKNPYREYKGPSAFGSVDILYPKTWSAAVTESNNGAVPVNGYLHPDFVPSTASKTAFALHVEVVEQPYDKVLSSFESKTKQGKVRVSPFAAAKVPGVLGARVDGEIETGLDGSLVVLPLRDKTIKIATESQQFIGDFDDIILPNLVFVP